MKMPENEAPRCPYCGQKMKYSQGMTVARYECQCGSHAPWVHAKLDDCKKMAYEAAMKRWGDADGNSDCGDCK